jgi:hypothetical protein
VFSFSFIFYLTHLFSFNSFFLSAVPLFKEKKSIFTSKVNVCRVVSSSARTKRNNEFPTACPASDSFDIGFVSSGNGWWWAPELTLLSGFTPFYFLLHVPSFFLFSIFYHLFLVKWISCTPFYASNSFIFGFALARNETCALTYHDHITNGTQLKTHSGRQWTTSFAHPIGLPKIEINRS